jgi:hypothetical protein
VRFVGEGKERSQVGVRELRERERESHQEKKEKKRKERKIGVSIGSHVHKRVTGCVRILRVGFN